jgi:hypothetical protein
VQRILSGFVTAVLAGYSPALCEELREVHGPGFLKYLTVESFGLSGSPLEYVAGFPERLTDGPFTSHGLECPRCIIRPTMERTKYVLPPFGSQITWTFANGRAEIFGGFGGINAWKPENTTIDPARLPAPGKKLRPGSASFSKSFNDAWLVQETVGTKVAVDPGRRVWLGVTGRFITNFGPGKGRWAGFGPTAAFRFGR